MEPNHERTKFRVKAELAVFEAMQRNGRLSEEGIARETNMPASTVHNVLERIGQRGFYEIRAVPRMDRFPEIPLAVIGFSDVHPMKLREIVEQYSKKVEVAQLFHGQKEALLVLFAPTKAALTETLMQLMSLTGEKPSLYLVSPTVSKFQATIPGKVLDEVYRDLPDRRYRV